MSLKLFARDLYTRTAVARHPCFSWAFLYNPAHVFAAHAHCDLNQPKRTKHQNFVNVATCAFAKNTIFVRSSDWNQLSPTRWPSKPVRCQYQERWVVCGL